MCEHSRHVREEKLGLTRARLRGIAELAGKREIVVVLLSVMSAEDTDIVYTARDVDLGLEPSHSFHSHT